MTRVQSAAAIFEIRERAVTMAYPCLYGLEQLTNWLAAAGQLHGSAKRRVQCGLWVDSQYRQDRSCEVGWRCRSVGDASSVLIGRADSLTRLEAGAAQANRECSRPM